MPPKRPPPLSPALFTGNGPLAPGSAPLPPEPSTIHPKYVIDAHTFAESTQHGNDGPQLLFEGLQTKMPKPEIRGVIQVKLDVSAEPASEIFGVKPFSIHPTILNLTLASPPSITNIANGTVDIIIPCVQNLSEKEWDLIDEAVNALDGSWGSAFHNKEEEKNKSGIIVISGLLPPTLTVSSSDLIRDPSYETYCGRLAQLSLHPNVYLKALPPIYTSPSPSTSSTSDSSVRGSAELSLDTLNVGGKWFEEKKEVSRVLRMYLAPAIETFGTHRIVFGSSTALPLASLNGEINMSHLTGHGVEEWQVMKVVKESEWYALLRDSVTLLGENEEAVSGLFGGNTAKLYGID